AAILKIGKNKKPKEVNADEWKKGEYSCFCCGAKLFRYVSLLVNHNGIPIVLLDNVYQRGHFVCERSDAKYWSGCGWPAFSKSIDNDLNIVRIKDYSLGMERTEVRCKQVSHFHS
uniref:peptide-methionine (R)-S-oxide reductase n=1 Tax=Parascaris equorum TaxID=6256 RepID=A0A914RTT4_PAREQ